VSDYTGEYKPLVECPGHGPMVRIYALGCLRLVECATCGKQPIDLLGSAEFGSSRPSTNLQA
jgi:hypothetical protein